MDSKWQLDGAVLGSNGLPQRVEGLEEALQNAALRAVLDSGKPALSAVAGQRAAGAFPKRGKQRPAGLGLGGRGPDRQPRCRGGPGSIR